MIVLIVNAKRHAALHATGQGHAVETRRAVKSQKEGRHLLFVGDTIDAVRQFANVIAETAVTVDVGAAEGLPAQLGVLEPATDAEIAAVVGKDGPADFHRAAEIVVKTRIGMNGAVAPAVFALVNSETRHPVIVDHVAIAIKTKINLALDMPVVTKIGASLCGVENNAVCVPIKLACLVVAEINIFARFNVHDACATGQPEAAIGRTCNQIIGAPPSMR